MLLKVVKLIILVLVYKLTKVHIWSYNCITKKKKLSRVLLFLLLFYMPIPFLSEKASIVSIFEWLQISYLTNNINLNCSTF